ncbi:MAG: PorV/PorQ family protein [bacterium]
MRKTILVATILLGLLAGAASCQTSDRAGSVGALFLKMDMSPRVAAMGRAYVGVADDISGIFLNPVALVNIEGMGVFGSDTEYLVDMRGMAGVFAFQMPENIGGVGALHYTGFFSGDMAMTTETDIDGSETDKTFTWNELAAGFTYAREFTDRFAVGVGAKYVRTSVADLYAQTVAFDVGTMYKTGFRNLRLGMSTTNFGPDMKFHGNYDNSYITSVWQVLVNEEYGYYPLPISFQVGLADEVYKSPTMRVTGALDYSHPNDLAERVHLGAEFAYNEMFFLRGGFFFDMDKSDVADEVNPDDDALDRYNEFRFGGGVMMNGVGVDYAWQSIENLESVHRIALRYSF